MATEPRSCSSSPLSEIVVIEQQDEGTDDFPLTDPTTDEKGKGKAETTDGDGNDYCHHCRRHVNAPLRCTLIRKTGKSAKATTFRCGRAFCHNGLKKYGLDAATIRAAGRTDKEPGKHDPDTSYTFECMACRDVCDCYTCRKRRGLEPVNGPKGQVTKTKTKQVSSKGEAAVDDAAPSKMSTAKSNSDGIKPKAVKPKIEATNGKVRATDAKAERPKAKPKAKPKSKPVDIKEVHPPVFERVLTTLGKSDGEARMELREFIFRFRTVLSLPDRNLGPLDDFDRPIAEATVRLLCGALLDLAKAEVGDDEDETLETCREEMRYHADLVRFVSVMRRIAPILDFDLPPLTADSKDQTNAQTNSNALRALFDLNEGESAPSWAALQSESVTRRGASKVPLPSEVVGMLLALCDRVLHTEKLRQELDSTGGEFEARRKLAADSKAVKEEWDKRKKKLAEEKVSAGSAAATKTWKLKFAKEEKEYQMKQAKVNVNLRVFLNRKASRFDPLGVDKEGRIYYLLSPRHISDDTRAPVGWASGVMVWGKGVQADEGDQIPPEVERWTHFGSHVDVKTLAEWVVYIAQPPTTTSTPRKRKLADIKMPTPAKKLKTLLDAESSLSSVSTASAAITPPRARSASFNSDSSGLTPPPDNAELERQMSLRSLLLLHKHHIMSPELQMEHAKDLAGRLLEAAEWLELLEHLGIVKE